MMRHPSLPARGFYSKYVRYCVESTYQHICLETAVLLDHDSKVQVFASTFYAGDAAT